MHTKYNYSNTKYTLFYNNLLYLFDLNYKKNRKKKSDFFIEIAISRNSEQRWKAGTIPAQTTLKRIIEYFNKYLDFSISISDILNIDLSLEQNKIHIVSDNTSEYDPLMREIVKMLKIMDDESKRAILAILNRIQPDK